MVSFLSSTFGVFLSVLCDNLLLTVVVPILPELLHEKEMARSRIRFANRQLDKNNSFIHPNNASASTATITGIATLTEQQNRHAIVPEDSSCLKQLLHLQTLNENSQLGILFSTKALVQLLSNPVVGGLTTKIGYKVPLCVGNFILFLCSLGQSIVFSFADSYMLFLIGRSCHGLASSLIAISGMALVAELYQYDKDRTRFLGRVMGAAALGVLLGYPFGGLFYAFMGKTIPFLTIAALALFNTGFHASKISLDWTNGKMFLRPKVNDVSLLPTSSWGLLKDKSIRIISIAIWLSTMAMAVLEPTLPVWLIDNIDPPKWQLGLVFVPDSLGYFVGTNFFGQFSLRLGRWKTSMLSMAAIGIACFVLPMGKQVWQLALPHFSLGLGLGIVDASLMPLLAKIADESYHAGYGAVYALAQTSVALAYSLGPLIGGQLVPLIGFPDLIRSIGLMNLLFCPFLLFLYDSSSPSEENGSIIPIQSHPSSNNQQNQSNTLLPENMQMTIMNKFIQPDTQTNHNHNNHHQQERFLYQRFYDDIEWD